MKEVISASRRTDMPSWYLDRLIRFVRQGYASVPNPYSRKVIAVDLRPENVHTIVLWSKNFGGFLEKSGCFSRYHLYFLFTINDMPALEPGIPPLSERLDQLKELALRFGAERIAWRYDPVIFTRDGPVSPVETFDRIGERISRAGVKRAIFSFLDLYGKVKNRNERFSLNLIEPPMSAKVEYAGRMAVTAKELGLSLESCSEHLEPIDGITPSACINGRLLSKLSGEPAKLAKDSGQRGACNCTVSRDIGSYRAMPCFNGCLYCYANPVIDNHSSACFTHVDNGNENSR